MLSDCISKDPTKAEILFVQEGADETAKHLRDRFGQAILPLSTEMIEIKNREISDDPTQLSESLDDRQFLNIVSALGVGVCLREEDEADSRFFHLDKLRYEKIILVTDPTPEGVNLRDQLVSLFYRHLKPLITAGHVYLVPPEPWVGMDEEELEAKVMSPETRRLVRLEAGIDLAGTLSNAEMGSGNER